MTRFSTHANRCLSIRLCLVTASIAIAALGKPGRAECAGAPTRVVIAYPSPTPRVAPLWLAQDLDFFGKYNLAAQIVLVRNNQMLAAGLAAGDIDVGYIEPGESQLAHTIDYLGAEHFLFASDIPHWDCEFPGNLQHIRNHAALSDEVKEQILYKNGKRLFNL